MSDFLRDFSARHFAGQPRTSLLSAVIEGFDPETLLQALGSGHPHLQRLAAKKLQLSARTPEFMDVILSGLAGETSQRVGLLTALSFLPCAHEPALWVAVEEQLHDADPDVRRAAARVIVYQFPEHAHQLLPLLEREDSTETARLLCLSGRVDLIQPLLARFGFPERMPPPILGVLIDPGWLAAEYPGDPRQIGRLIEACGYSDAPVTEVTLDLLRRGFMYVSRDMIAAPAPETDRERILELCWQLLPEQLEMSRGDVAGVSLEDPRDQALFMAAAREADRANLEEWKARDPFSYRSLESPRVVACSHAHAPFVRRQLIELPLQLAEELGVPATHRGQFLVEHGRCFLETDEETRTEYELFLRCRWSRDETTCDNAGPKPDSRFPVRDEADFPVAHCSVLREFDRPPDDPGLSAGANSIRNVAEYLGRRHLSDWLLSRETGWRDFLPPIGCELQVPLIERNRSLAWKQALRSLGIPSPRRPEYRSMVEAAFPPSISFHAQALGPLLLHRLGLMPRPQDMALHISIQGDLGDEVRYLAFPSLFIRPSVRMRNRPEWTMTRVMSKGLVNINEDVVTCRDDQPATVRTEIRVFRCFVDEADSGLEVPLGYVDDIVSTHLLAAAMLSADPDFRGIINDYRAAVESAVSGLPAAFAELLHANYFESTGDPRDAGLLEFLPIMHSRRAVRAARWEGDLAGKLERLFLDIRRQHAERVFQHAIASSAVDPAMADDISWSANGAELRWPVTLLDSGSV